MDNSRGNHSELLGVILAGGKSSRMNSRDKYTKRLGSLGLLEHVIGCLQSQVDQLVISGSKGSPLDKFGYLVIPDTIQGYLGPLVGVRTSLSMVGYLPR
ncbi:MAG: molybdopterin-guanine dinucleotide biosynthesis protein A [Cellvibrionaceae bacterium]|jgi:molybdopterin-guanine dinucleotide biosynthesis protein A